MERRIKFLKHREIKSVAFQGERGAFSEQAAIKFFGGNVFPLSTPTFEDVVKAVIRGRANSGVLPIENSLHGSVLENYDLLLHHHLFIIGEVKLRIVHHLLAHKTVSLDQIRRVYSHPQALAQCRSFLKKLSHAEPLAFYDTAGAAKFVVEQKFADAAAIASAQAARVYGLKVLARGIENNHQNYTRFLVLARYPVKATTQAKTSVVFTVKNVPGSLYTALSSFAARKINLHKVESRPIVGRPWEYLFYVDFEGSVNEHRCSEAIESLRKVASSVRVLGSYRKG